MSLRRDDSPFVLRGSRLPPFLGGAACPEITARDGRVVSVETRTSDARVVDVDGAFLLPGLINAHDHLDLSVFPPLGQPPQRDLYEWSAAVSAAVVELHDLLALPLVERHFLGGLRNLLAGATAVAHHGPYHRALGRDDFPVRVQDRYQFAHSPGHTPALRKLYRSTDRRIPWFVHAGEGLGESSRLELDVLAAANVLRQNTVVIHGLAFGAPEAERLAAAKACVVWQPEAARRLYGAGTDVLALRAHGVRVGLGSDSAATGTRDLLSTLAAARREGLLDDADLVELATRGSAEVARLPLGARELGAPADFVVVSDPEAWLSGDRRSLALVIVAGRALFGLPAWMALSGERCEPVIVEGAERRLSAPLARRARALFERCPSIRRASWAGGLEWPR